MKWGLEMSSVRIVLGKHSGMVRHGTGHSPKECLDNIPRDAQGGIGWGGQGLDSLQCKWNSMNISGQSTSFPVKTKQKKNLLMGQDGSMTSVSPFQLWIFHDLKISTKLS